MIRKTQHVFTKLVDFTEENLRRMCGEITPGKRLVIILGLSSCLGISSIYLFVYSIYTMGETKGRQLEIEHMRMLDLQRKDSINALKIYDYEQSKKGSGTEHAIIG